METEKPDLPIQSEQIEKIAAALAKAQGVIQAPKKNRNVKVSGVSKKGKSFSYDFKYADLEECIAVSQKPIAENEISCIHQNVWYKAKPWLFTRLIHSSGQWFGSYYKLPEQADDAKEFAAEITYGRRYQYCELVNLAAEDDNDAPPPRSEVTGAETRRSPAQRPASKPPPNDGVYRIDFGEHYPQKTLEEVFKVIGALGLKTYGDKIKTYFNETGKPLTPQIETFFLKLSDFLLEKEMAAGDPPAALDPNTKPPIVNEADKLKGTQDGNQPK